MPDESGPLVASVGAMPRLLLVDDHVMVAQALRCALEHEGTVEVVGEAADGRTACQMVRHLRPGVVVMEVVLPELCGIEATREILAEAPATRIIALSGHCEGHLVQGMLQAGACGYVSKSSPLEDLVQAVRAALRGQMYFTPDVTRAALEISPPLRSGGRHGFGGLSPRQREVLQLLAEGHATKGIGVRLKLSAKTVEAHRGQIMAKLDIHSLAGLVKFAVREGLTPLEH